MDETEILSELGKRIKLLRLKKGITQHELARGCGFEKASMSRIEAGQANPTVRTLYKICRVLKIGIDELFKD